MEGITEINKEDYIDDCVKIVKELVVDEEFSDEKNIASPCPAGDGGGRAPQRSAGSERRRRREAGNCHRFQRADFYP